MTAQSLTPRNHAVTSGKAPLESVAHRIGDCYWRNEYGWELLTGKIAPCWLSLNCRYKTEIQRLLRYRNRASTHAKQKSLASLKAVPRKATKRVWYCLTSCDRFVCNHWTWSSCKGDKLYQEEMALASSFKLAFQVSLTGCSYTYRLLNRNLYFQAGVPICRCPIYQYISDQGQPLLHTYSIVQQGWTSMKNRLRSGKYSST